MTPRAAPRALRRAGHQREDAPRLLAALSRLGLALADLVAAAGAETHDGPRLALASLGRWARGEDGSAALAARYGALRRLYPTDTSGPALLVFSATPEERRAEEDARTRALERIGPRAWWELWSFAMAAFDCRADVTRHPTHAGGVRGRALHHATRVLLALGEPEDAARARAASLWGAAWAAEGDARLSPSQAATAALDALELTHG